MSLDQQFNRRQMIVRSAGGILALTAGGLVVSACGSDGPTPVADAGGPPPARPTGTLTRSYSLEVDTLDPAVAVSGGLPFIASIYEGLLRYDERSPDPVASLATAWRQSDDGLEW
jgi:ABC-type transport system substrate-binding protein